MDDSLDALETAATPVTDFMKSMKKKKKKKKRELADTSGSHVGEDGSFLRELDDNCDEIATPEQGSSSPGKKKTHKKNSQNKPTDEWTTEDRNLLLDSVAKYLPAKDTKSFRFMLRRLNWDEVAEPLSNKTGSQCLQELSKIIKSLSTIKSMTQIICDARDKINDPAASQKRILLPRSRFMKEVFHQYKDIDSVNRMSAIWKAWSELPTEERKRYEDEYLQEKLAAGMIIKNSRKKGYTMKTPCELYIEKICLSSEDKDVMKVRKEARTQWKDLKDKKKVKYIKKAIALVQEMVDNREIDPANEIFTKDFSKLFSKNEACTYLSKVGFPVEQPKSKYQMFYAESKLGEYEDKPNIGTLTKAFSQLTQKTQNEYSDRAKENLDAYNEAVAKWRREHGILDVLISEKIKKIKPEDQQDSSSKQSEHKTEKLNIVEISKKPEDILFEDQPRMLVKSPYELFRKKFLENEDENDDKMEAAAAGWASLSKAGRKLYSTMYEEYKRNYAKCLLEYVADMDEGRKALYLGKYRVPFIKLFKGVDIFSDKYPSEKYPSLVSTKSLNKRLVRASSEMDMDGFNEETLDTDTSLHNITAEGVHSSGSEDLNDEKYRSAVASEVRNVVADDALPRKKKKKKISEKDYCVEYTFSSPSKKVKFAEGSLPKVFSNVRNTANSSSNIYKEKDKAALFSASVKSNKTSPKYDAFSPRRHSKLKSPKNKGIPFPHLGSDE